MTHQETQRPAPAGWQAERIRDARVVVVGQNLLGFLVASSLHAMGVGHVIWLGKARPEVTRLTDRMLSSGVEKLAFDPEYERDVDWIASAAPIAALVSCQQAPDQQAVCHSAFTRRGARCLTGIAAGGGSFWISGTPMTSSSPDIEPIAAFAVSAMLVDAVRQFINPLPGDGLPPTGLLGLPSRRRLRPRQRAIVVGVGAIGSFLTLLLARLGFDLHLVDFDRVEETNLTNQLFSEAAAREHAHKSLAAREALQVLFPHRLITAEVRRVDLGYEHQLSVLRPQPAFLLSSVDNAATRADLASLGQSLRLPVVQGSIATHAADCFVQRCDAQPLDELMEGALTRARQREQDSPRQGTCLAEPPLVTAAVMAAALMGAAVVRISAGGEPFSFHWRAGGVPVERRQGHAGLLECVE